MCVNTEKQTDVHTHSHTHKAPFRTRAYTDIKGPLFSPSYRYSTGGLCCEHIYVYAAVCETTMYRVNSCRHPPHPELTVTWVCVHMPFGLVFFLCEQLRNNSSSTNNAQRSRTIAPLTVFVCGGGETGNEIMLRALAVCAKSLSESRARPRGEYQSLISRPRWVYGNEEQFIQCNVSKQGGICGGYTRHCHLSPALYLLRSVS